MPEKPAPEKKGSFVGNLVGGLFESYIKGLMKFALSLLEKKMKRYLVATVVLIASLATILYGAGTLVGFVSGLPPGVSHILVGIAAILVWLAYDRRR